ncbi:MAG: endopeptidase La [Defluviitaleaceae bacterium]|nr:endopeptidase La [Defluviitaleaceae bacterium]
MSDFIKLPLIALRGLVMFPNNVLSFDVGRSKSVEAMEKASSLGKDVFLTAQREPNAENPSAKELFSIGTISEIKRIMPIKNDIVRVIAGGKQKARITEFTVLDDYFEVTVEPVIENFSGILTIEEEALMQSVKDAFSQFAVVNPKILPEIGSYIDRCRNPFELADVISANAGISFDKKQEVLELNNPAEKLSKVLEHVLYLTEVSKIQNEINIKVRSNLDQLQKEHYLREQSKVINEELGDKAGTAAEVDDYKEKIEKMTLPERVKQKLDKELKRLKKSTGHAQEGVVIRDYIEWMLDLPWSEKSEETPDLHIAERVLGEDHYGLKEVKDRVLEFLAVRQNTNSEYSPILCFAGPPGVGKTSVAKSIARALGREYVRMSLGGVKDESEIRGHRRTYVGAMPGRIIYSMRQAKKINPVILLDEIDKLSSDYKGDPSSALLEVLDSEQNVGFRDHYLEVPYDLSDCMFICTANDQGRIPPALLDRLEIIELSSYTSIEKQHIAEKFLLPKQLKKHGIHTGVMYLDTKAIPDMIEFYTKEAGVRQLERLIAKICRKVVKKTLLGGSMPVEIYASDLEEYLGARKFKSGDKTVIESPGIAIGLAWTRYGGDILPIEVNSFKGRGKFELTGNMGDVMKESAKAAMSFIRANTDELGVDDIFYRNTDLHIHIPEGAVPKDGPSAGISMCTAMISQLSKKTVCDNVAMSGEITIRGNVLPVGGLKEKILAAKHKGIEKVILPHANIGDVVDIDHDIKEGLDIVFVKTMSEVVEHAFGEQV